MSDTDQWPTSNREKMLEALKQVLEGIPGVQYVDRQDLDPTGMIAEAQRPAIIIDEERTRYEWLERHDERKMEATSGLVLDLQADAPKSADRAGYDVSTIRELFVARVIQELADESTLTVQLASENSEQQHADDAALEFEVRYPSVPEPGVRAVISISIESCEVFDGRTKNTWDTLAGKIWAHDDSDSPPDFEVTTEG